MLDLECVRTALAGEYGLPVAEVEIVTLEHIPGQVDIRYAFLIEERHAGRCFLVRTLDDDLVVLTPEFIDSQLRNAEWVATCMRELQHRLKGPRGRKPAT